MKVILNVDVKHLGEEGDVKNVANGYARNYLLPRELAVPFTPETEAIFEAKKAEIEARKEVKRQNAKSLKERLEGSSFTIEMPAGANGKLYGAVTPQIISDMLTKNGFELERKRIELPGAAIKSVGNYKATIKLYEAQTAEITVCVKTQGTEEESQGAKKAEKKAEPKAEEPSEPKDTEETASE